MSEEPRKNNGLRRALALGGAVVVIGGGTFLVTHAQDKTAETPAQVLTAATAPATTPDKPVSYADMAARDAAIQVKDPPAQSASASAQTRPVLKQPFRGDTVFGRPILQRRPLAPAKVDWQKALSQASQMQPKRLAGGMATRLQKGELDKTRLPVILPRDGGLIKNTKARLLSFGDAYALNMPQDNGIQITAYGNRSFVPAESGAVSKRPVQKLLDVAEDVRISRMEDGWTATFTRYGVVYSIDVTCDDINAPDCQNDNFIRKAVAEFSDVTMGAQAQAEAQTGNQTARPAQTSWIDNITSMFKPKGS